MIVARVGNDVVWYQLPRLSALVFTCTLHPTLPLSQPGGIACQQLFVLGWNNNCGALNRLKVVTVVATHSVAGVKPDVALLILPHLNDHIRWQPIGRRYAFRRQVIVSGHADDSRCNEAKGRQQSFHGCKNSCFYSHNKQNK